jgi:hypothetical protein
MVVGKLFEDCGTQAEFLPTSQCKRMKRGNPQGAMVGSRFCATFVDAKVARSVGAEAHVTWAPRSVNRWSSPERSSPREGPHKIKRLNFIRMVPYSNQRDKNPFI